MRIKTSDIFTQGLIDMLRSPDDAVRRQGFEMLTQSICPRIFRLAKSVLGNESDAEDCVQEFLMKLWRIDWNEVHEPAAHTAVCFYRHVIHHLHRNLQNSLVSLSEADPETGASFTDTIKDPFVVEQARTREADELFRILEVHMSENDKLLYRLRCTERMKFNKIAQDLGTNEVTARQRWNYLIGKLRKKLTEDEFNEISNTLGFSEEEAKQQWHELVHKPSKKLAD